MLRQDIPAEHEEVNDDVNINYASLRQMDNSQESFQNVDSPEKHFTDKSEKAGVEDDATNDSVCSAISDDSSNTEEPKLVLIDYEYCSYNHRGFDLANHFVEWAYDYTNPDYPYYYENLDHYPTLEQKVMCRFFHYSLSLFNFTCSFSTPNQIHFHLKFVHILFFPYEIFLLTRQMTTFFLI